MKKQLKTERLEIRLSKEDKESLLNLSNEYGLSMGNMLLFLLKREIKK
ncbi:MAG: hypothetical protein ACRC1T_09070 [Clostridium chrysemydis]